MNKPGLFRAALLAAMPSLATDPERLSIFVENGNLVGSGEPGAGWEYRYKLTVIVQDFAEDMDSLAAVVMAFMCAHQPDTMTNPVTAANAVRFEVELMSTELADVSIELDMVEAVLPGAAAGEWVHPDEPPADPTALY